MSTKILVIIAMLFIIPAAVLSPQVIKEMEFRNQPITDILLALAEMTGMSIIPDETVDGKASYFFSETDFESALKVFLETYNLYYRKEDSIYYISRIRTEYDEESGLISMDAEGVEMAYLVRAVSKAIGKTVLFDSLPPQPLTIHTKNVVPNKLLDIIMKRFPEYSLEVDDDYYYIKRSFEQQEFTGPQTPGSERLLIKREQDIYSIIANKARFFEIIDAFFQKANYEYSLLMKRDQLIERVRFYNKRFDQLLRLILEQGSADFKKVGDIYYIFEITQADVLKKLKSTVRIPLLHVPVQEVTRLFPPGLAAGRFFNIDTTSNSIILSGSLEEIGPIQEFLKEIDQPQENQSYYRFDLNYVDIKNLQSILPPSYKFSAPITVPNTNSFVMLLTPEKKESLEQYLSLIDRSTDVAYVQLKYIKGEYLKKHLPPSLSAQDIVETGDPSIVFVKGSQKKLEIFFKELEVLDRPVPQIRYEILIVQYQEGHGLNWNQSLTDNIFTVKPKEDTQGQFIGSVGQLLSLNFDVISSFGYQFALNLNLDLSEEDANVLADTSLNALSGEEVKFQNTSTFRYREYEADPNTGDLKPTGVVREISSGLIVNIKGWVSGDGMITMDVNSTVSRRGADTSSTGKPPTTFEKIVNTHVRSDSGTPVVIGGLIQHDKQDTVQKVPVLGDIPLLGYLFRSRKQTIERSEFVIYIVPFADLQYQQEMSVGDKIERLYHKFFNSKQAGT